MDTWIEKLLREVFIPMGVTLNGEVMAQGEEHGDVWAMRITDNRFERRTATISYDFE
jgi:hypothetical protein